MRAREEGGRRDKGEGGERCLYWVALNLFKGYKREEEEGMGTREERKEAGRTEDRGE
jgi:hypothetical protein